MDITKITRENNNRRIGKELLNILLNSRSPAHRDAQDDSSQQDGLAQHGTYIALDGSGSLCLFL